MLYNNIVKMEGKFICMVSYDKRTKAQSFIERIQELNVKKQSRNISMI